MRTVLLVPGACHGGWWFETVTAELSRRGQHGAALTLAGLGPDGLDGAGPVTLDTHVDQAVAAVTAACDATGRPVVLAGHSYGGIVITATADRVPDRIRALVYLDAFLPEDGDSCWSMTSDEQRDWYIHGAARTGLAVDPQPFFDQRARPHPLATLVQRVRLRGAWRQVPGKTYVAATVWPGGLAGSPFVGTARRVAADPDWAYLEWPTTHNILGRGPGPVVDLLLAGGGHDRPTRVRLPDDVV